MSPQLLRICSVLAGLALAIGGVFVLRVGQAELAAAMFTASGGLIALPAQPKSMTIAPPPPLEVTIVPPPEAK